MTRLLRRTERAFGALFMLLVLASFILHAVAPSSSTSDDEALPGRWGLASKALWIGVVSVALAGFAVGLIRRARMTPTELRSAVADADFDVACVRHSELVVQYDESDGTWRFSGSNGLVAAFSEIDGRLGCELIIRGDWYSIPGPSRRRGGVLARAGKLIAKGFGSAWYSGYKVYFNGVEYRLKPKFLTLSASKYRLCRRRKVLTKFDRMRRNQWRIEGQDAIDSILLVFAFWLVRQDLLRAA